MGRFVIAAFRPLPGRQAELLEVVERHWRVLRAEALVTDQPRHAMQAADGTVIEVFEWRSPEAIEQAHVNPAVQALWRDFEAVCTYVPLAAVAEAAHPFSEFQPCIFAAPMPT